MENSKQKKKKEVKEVYLQIFDDKNVINKKLKLA